MKNQKESADQPAKTSGSSQIMNRLEDIMEASKELNEVEDGSNNSDNDESDAQDAAPMTPKEQEKLAEKENRAVYGLRFMVLILLVASAVGEFRGLYTNTFKSRNSPHLNISFIRMHKRFWIPLASRWMIHWVPRMPLSPNSPRMRVVPINRGPL